ncbi:MAG: pantoate--beta-alanine ligase [Cyclobacteriaceae bacterium]|nr:pantoate--beta-alanine ligase [Cyclobacteriaceae bacterium]
MEVFREIQGLRHFLSAYKQQRKSIGFVPTMGALHQGHLELVRKSMSQNDITVCSIFVNPTQFNNPSDLEKYPRDVDADLAKLEKISCGVVFLPDVDEMYDKEIFVNIHFGYLENVMEGKFRPGHFKGVGLIVAKLFNVVLPSRAYFGTKDLQQLAIITQLCRELLFDIEIIPVQTVREPDGLAMSSRNELLSSSERPQATDLYKALLFAREKLIDKESVESVKKNVRDFFESDSAVELEYFEIVNTDDLQNISDIGEAKRVSLCLAGYLGKVRLIDNISLY